FAPEQIYIITNAQYAPQVAEAIAELPAENIVGEPIGRDTANAIALAAELIAAKDDQATMAVFTADHVIRPKDRFLADIGTACDAAEANPDALVNFGIRPTWPHTGLGYIHCGHKLPNGAYEVLGIKEKPDHKTARGYVEDGRHFWNSGMFVWTLKAIRGALTEFLGDSVRKLAPIGRAVRDGRDYTQLLADIYPTLEKISIDYAVMEKAHNALMVELNCQWLDIGSWPAIADVAEADDAGNVILAENSALLDSARNVIVAQDAGADHLLAVLGMDDCVIIHSADATLVCRKSDSQRLKELVALLKEKFGDRYL
ncbi:MAG: mannose-1-phosphate guanylyltransferase, partial [Planctomycetes bacterium]|nr:mannose-1-phosphate guanylyltransferase [Planctomycetota bacterium]